MIGNPVDIVCCHAEGEVGDVIIGGVDPPPGDTIWAQARWIDNDRCLRDFVLNEPRGGVFRHANLLVPAISPEAVFGFIIMEPAHTPPMSGSNTICVATVLLERGFVPMAEPESSFTLEAPGGLVRIRAQCRNGKARRIEFDNVPCFVDRLDAKLEVEGHGTLNVDTAFGGDSFVLVDAGAMGHEVRPEEARDLAETGQRVIRAANEQLGFRHPERDWNHLSFCQFTCPIEERQGVLHGRSAVAIEPGKIDRSPTGTGCSARMAVLHARGIMSVGDRFVGHSIIDSTFRCAIVRSCRVGERDGIVPSIGGRAWITGTRQLMLDRDDPWPQGYRLSDTWPNAQNS